MEVFPAPLGEEKQISMGRRSMVSMESRYSTF